MTIPALNSSTATEVLSHATSAPPPASSQTQASARGTGKTSGTELVSSATNTPEQPASSAPASMQEVQQAMDAAEAASESTRDTFCACYQSGEPYNGDEAACRAELDGISVSIISCDLALAATWPEDALAFYECRRTVAGALDACFATCSS